MGTHVRRASLLSSFVMAAIFAHGADASVLYVNASASAGGDGAAWASAYNHLEDALTNAAGNPGVTEIWVTQGTYKPATSDRTKSFVLVNGVSVYGGFIGDEATLGQRDSTNNVTILSGDLAGNDGPNFANNGENSLHVVRAGDITTTATIDGFTITGGNANGAALPENRGGGILYDDVNASGTLTVSHCTAIANFASNGGSAAYFNRGLKVILAECAFNLNSATENGGAVVTNLGGLGVNDCTFTGNTTTKSGGAFYIQSPLWDLTFVNCTFSANFAAWSGGALYCGTPNQGYPIFAIRDCSFTANSTTPGLPGQYGGALYCDKIALRVSGTSFIGNTARIDGGAVWARPDPTNSPNLNGIANCTFNGNQTTVGSGGAFYLQSSNTFDFAGCVFSGNTAASQGGAMVTSTGVRFRNCTIYGNHANSASGGILSGQTDMLLQNSIFWGNTAPAGTTLQQQIDVPNFATVTSYSTVQGWTTGGVANNALNPTFEDADGADNVLGTEDDDFRLASSSPCIDTGDNSKVSADVTDIDADGNVAEPIPLDMLGVDRFVDDPAADGGAGAPPLVDRGALERGTPTTTTVWVGRDGSSWFARSSWEGGVVPNASTNVVIDGAVVIGSVGAIAKKVTLTGAAQLTLTGSLTCEALVLGSSTTLIVNDANALLATGSIQPAAGSTINWTSGTIILSNGSWANPIALSIGCAGPCALGLSGTAIVSASSITVCAQGTVSGNGTLSSTVTNNGIVAPGSALASGFGTIIVTGDFAQSATGSLKIDVGAYDAGTFDVLKVNQGLTRGGALQIVATPGFSSEVGSSQLFLSGTTSLLGSFATTSVPPPFGLIQFATAQAGLTMSLTTSLVSSGPRLYVDADAAANGDGQSWSGAMRSVSGAVNAATALPGVVQEIWVAEGTYLPTKRDNPSDPTSATVRLVEGASMYGGFAGGETQLSQRDFVAYPTIITGDRLGNDGPNFTNYDDNLVIAVRAEYGNPWVVPTYFDGFTIRGAQGHGMLLGVIAATVRNCTFTANAAGIPGGGQFNKGGGLYVTSSSLIENCKFIANMATSRGGGAFVSEVFQHPVFRNCWFEANTTPFFDGIGAGLATGAAATDLIECTFVGNAGNQSNGMGAGGLYGASTTINVVSCNFFGNTAIGNAGGAYVGSGTVVNCVFSGNTTNGVGGALHTDGTVSIVNCSIASNTAAQTRGGISTVAGATATISNCILWNNSDSTGQTQAAQVGGPGAEPINYSIVKGWTGSLGGTANNGSNPAFVDIDGSDNVVGTIDDDLRLSSASPGIDSASNTLVPADATDLDGDANVSEKIPFDGDGNARFFDDPMTPNGGAGTPPIVDRGAFEYGAALPAGQFVGPSGGSWFNPSYWAGGAVPTAATEVTIPTVVVVSGGTALANGVSIVGGGVLVIDAGTVNVNSVNVSANGTLNLVSSSSLLEAVSLTLAANSTLQWQAGTIQIDGGTLTSSAGLSIGCAGSAILRLVNGATVTAPTLALCSTGILTGIGTVTSAVTNGGRIEPGASPGTLHITGSYAQSASGHLALDFAGYEPGISIDLLTVSGTASLDGTLEVHVARAFAPGVALTNFLEAASISGSFATIDASGLNPGHTIGLQNTGAAMAVITVPSGPVIRVDSQTPSIGDGSNWKATTPDLQAALIAAALSNGSITQMWVKAGTYRPSHIVTVNDLHPGRTATFALAANVQLLGGFAGGEISASQRDPESNITVLSGDIMGDDLSDGPDGTADNAYHVISAVNVTGALVDGVIVQSGVAENGGTVANALGGGVRASGATLTINQCRIETNIGAESGGGVFADNASIVTITSTAFAGNQGGDGGAVGLNGGSQATCTTCTFELNSAGLRGGAIALEANSSAIATNCSFTGNTSGNGAGAVEMLPGCAFTARHCTFTGHTCSGDGGAIRSETATLNVADCTFTDNHCSEGGAIHTKFGGAITVVRCGFFGNGTGSRGGAIANNASVATIIECIFSGNTTTSFGGALYLTSAVTSLTDCTIASNNASVNDGGGIFAHSGTNIVRNCIVWANTDMNNGSGEAAQIKSDLAPFAIDWTTVQAWSGAFGGTGNSGAAPLFVDIDGLDDTVGTPDDNLRLSFGSPSIDSGSNALIAADVLDIDNNGNTSEPLPLDFAGHLRRIDNPVAPDAGSGTAPIVDRGAYEFEAGCPGCPGDSVWVDPTGGLFVDASNWFPAVPTSANAAVFALAATYVVSASAPITTDRLAVNAGNVTIDLNGATYTVGSPTVPSLQVGADDGDSATLTLTDGAMNAVSVVVGGAAQQASLNVSGAVVSATGLIDIGLDGAGKLALGAPATINAPSVHIELDGSLEGVGNVASTLTNVGHIVPGGSGLGTLTVVGALQQTPSGSGRFAAGGTVEMQVGGTSIGAHDLILVSGSASLAGTLVVSLANGYVPQPGDVITLMTATAITGSFELAFLPPVDEGLALAINYVHGAGFDSVTLSVIAVSTNVFVFDAAALIGGLDTPHDARLADVDNDGDLDLLVTVVEPKGKSGSFLVFQNQGIDGSGTWLGFAAPLSTTITEEPRAIGLGDFNADGVLDAAVAQWQFEKVAVLTNNGSGAFSLSNTFESPDGSEWIAAGKFVGDDKDDIVVLSSVQNRQRFFQNLGVSGFALNHTLNAGGNFIDALDVNDDGTPDTIAAYFGHDDIGLDATVIVSTRDPKTGEYEIVATYATGNGTTRFITTDLNGDGAPDVITADYWQGTSSILINSANGSATFAPPLIMQVGAAPTSVGAADFDGDGDEDLVFAAENLDGERVLRLKRNNLVEGVQPQFVDVSPVLTGGTPSLVLVGDLNLDGVADLVALNDTTDGVAGLSSGSVSVHLNHTAAMKRGDLNADGVVNASDLGILLGSWGTSGIGDINGDGIVNAQDLAILLGAWS